jgi:L-threonylcarbamoyladenylate synthase
MIELDCNSDFNEIAPPVLRGSVIVYPTDTVFGLGTNPLSVEGVRRCFEIKSRDATKQFPVLFSSLKTSERFVEFSTLARNLAEHFWPGKLTIILRARDVGFPPELVGRSNTLGVRVPSHECCLRLLTTCGGCLIGTSANISGEPPSSDPDDPNLHRLANRADYFVRGSCGENPQTPSTVVDMSEGKKIILVREGAIPKEKIAAHLAKISNADFSFSATVS